MSTKRGKTDDHPCSRVVSVRLEPDDFERLDRYVEFYKNDGVTRAYVLQYCILTELENLMVDFPDEDEDPQAED